jgi:signal transduction histidine kinase
MRSSAEAVLPAIERWDSEGRSDRGGAGHPPRPGLAASAGARPAAAIRPSAATDAETDRASRVRTFLLLRFTLIVATGYLLLGQGREIGLHGGVLVLLAAALGSNLLLVWRRPRHLASTPWTGAVLVVDTLWVTAALVVSGRFEGEFLYLYFFVLFLAALAESLHLIALGAVLVSCSYLYALVAEGGFEPLTSPAYLVRIPFLVAVATFYGYFVERVRHQQRRSREEAVAAGRTEHLLRRTNRQVQELGELKSRFVSLVSHELRTPLTATRNAIGLVGRAGETSAEQRRFLDMGQRNLDRLGRILDDLFDLSKMEARGLELSFSAADPAALAAEAAAAFEAQAAEAALELAVGAEPGLPAVWADPVRSGQVLANLLSNALKFTPAGGRVTVHAALEGDAPGFADPPCPRPAAPPPGSSWSTPCPAPTTRRRPREERDDRTDADDPARRRRRARPPRHPRLPLEPGGALRRGDRGQRARGARCRAPAPAEGDPPRRHDAR